MSGWASRTDSVEACVVIAGGREPSQWEKYGHHRFMETNGALRCCDNGGCWKARCRPLGDGDEKDRPENLCVEPVAVSPELSIARCMDLVTVGDVIRAIELYYEGGALEYLPDRGAGPQQNASHLGVPEPVCTRELS